MLFTFPSRYWFTIGHWGVFSLGRRSSRIPTGFLVSRRTQDPLRSARSVGYRAFAFFGRPFQVVRLKRAFLTPCGVSYNPKEQALWFGLFPFRSPLLRKSHLLSLPPGTEMFQFPGSALLCLWIQQSILSVQDRGFPHSEIFGSMLTYSSPKRIGVRSVLHRLPVPRHPPCAL